MKKELNRFKSQLFRNLINSLNRQCNYCKISHCNWINNANHFTRPTNKSCNFFRLKLCSDHSSTFILERITVGCHKCQTNPSRAHSKATRIRWWFRSRIEKGFSIEKRNLQLPHELLTIFFITKFDLTSKQSGKVKLLWTEILQERKCELYVRGQIRVHTTSICRSVTGKFLTKFSFSWASFSLYFKI